MSNLEKKLIPPTEGEKIAFDPISKKFIVPDHPIIPYIIGDGIGVDITPVMIKTVDYAVQKAYKGQKKIHWFEIYAGERAVQFYNTGLPECTLEAIREYKFSIKGPLTTPVGEGFRSINVALRQKLDLYLCQRPIKYYSGVPSPLKEPEKTKMVIFRENSEDIYAGIEWQGNTSGAKQVIDFLQNTMGVNQIRFTQNCGIGVKPVSEAGSKRLIRRAIKYAIQSRSKVITIVHKGNIMKFTEGAFKNWAYEVAKQEFGATDYNGGPWQVIKLKDSKHEIVVNDIIADAFLQQILLRPEDYSVIATLNLNGDYISDALAAQVGGIGIAPGANLSDDIALFEATHGTAPKHAGKNEANPGSIILSAVMMLEHMGWKEAAELLELGLAKSISNRTVTYDFARMMDHAKLCSTSEFGDEIIKQLGTI